MPHLQRHARRRFPPRAIILAALSPLVGLLPVTVIGADSAAAAPSPGYTASFVPAGSGTPVSIAVDPVTDTVYVGEYLATGYELVVMDGSSHAIEATVPLAAIPSDMAVDSATNTVYVIDGSQIAVVDGATNSVKTTIPMPAGFGVPMGVAADSSTDMIYVASSAGGGAVVIDGSSNTVTTTFSSGGAAKDIAVDETTNVVWVTHTAGPVVAISGSDGSIIHSVSLSEPLYLAVNPVTDTVYVGSSIGANPLTVIDGAAGTITTTVPVTGTWTGRLAVDPVADIVFARGCAASCAGLIVIDGATNTVADVLNAATGTTPAGFAVDPATGTAYATSSFPGIWAITTSASNGISPLITAGPASATATEGEYFFPGAFSASGLPTPTFSETGALPAGVTLSASGVLSGTPAAGTAGVYPITVTVSNGIAPDSSVPFTLTVMAAPAAVVGVEGTDGELWVRAPQLGAGWHSLGGVITAPPAVAANPGGATLSQPLFIGTGTDKRLWIRSLADGWQPVGAARCIGGPAAVIYNGTLTVACRGTDNALWYTTTTVPATGLPAFTGPWISLGGVLSAGPAAAPVGTALTFFVRGSNGAIFTRTAAAGYSQTSWACIGAPSAAQQAADGVTTFACQGTDHALWEASNAGSGWSAAMSLGGTLIGGPAVAATSQQTEFFAEGTNHAVYQNTAAGWASLGGGAVGGVGAAALN